MRRGLAALIAVALLSGCGEAAREPTPPGPVPPGLEDALDEFQASMDELARSTPAPTLPGYRVPPSAATGDELWSTVVDPMFGAEDPEHDLSPLQFAAFATFLIDYEIGNGGFWQLYFNAPGAWAQQGPALLRLLGAEHHAAVLERANRRFGAPVPANDAPRRARVERLDQATFAAFDDAWYEGVPLGDVVARYIAAHPDEFFA